MSFLVVLVKKIDGPGLPGGLIIYQGHLFPLKGHLCRESFFLSLLLLSPLFFSGERYISPYFITNVKAALGAD